MLLSNSTLIKYVARVGQFFIAASLIGTVLSPQARAQISFGSAYRLVDNVANQGSPTIILFNSVLTMYYVNHSNNTIYVDSGLSGSPSSTGIVVDSGELTDVGAAVLNGKVLLSYVSPSNDLEFALSTNGIKFGTAVNPTNSSLGLGSQGPNTAFVPALVSNGTTAYVATVGANGSVYMASTTDGNTFTPLVGSGNSVSSNTTISRPSLTMYLGDPWVGFTSNTPGPRQAVVGDATGQDAEEVGGNVSWGNSNRSGNYAGIALLSYNGILYVYGQDTASSQQLKYMYSNGGSSWTAAADVGNQMRWTPSLTLSTSNIVYLVYQDDADTNISYRFN
jgi:hypothetical protein